MLYMKTPPQLIYATSTNTYFGSFLCPSLVAPLFYLPTSGHLRLYLGLCGTMNEKEFSFPCNYLSEKASLQIRKSCVLVSLSSSSMPPSSLLTSALVVRR
jgi:hypothetical protein